MSFVFQLQHYLRDKQELFFEKRTPRDTPELSLKESIQSDQVEKKDVLLSYPFESMKPFIKMLNDAAEDPDVVSIKMTLIQSGRQEPDYRCTYRGCRKRQGSYRACRAAVRGLMRLTT